MRGRFFSSTLPAPWYSIMVWGSEVINNPSGGGRESSDALLIAEVRNNE